MGPKLRNMFYRRTVENALGVVIVKSIFGKIFNCYERYFCKLSITRKEIWTYVICRLKFPIAILLVADDLYLVLCVSYPPNSKLSFVRASENLTNYDWCLCILTGRVNGRTGQFVRLVRYIFYCIHKGFQKVICLSFNLENTSA